MNRIPNDLRLILNAILREEGIPYFVGGTVRDFILGIAPNDFDLEVYGLSAVALEGVLRRYGQVSVVEQAGGKSIFEMRHNGNDIYQFSLRDTSLRVSCEERDFTMNAMMMDYPHLQLVDFFNGYGHLRAGIIRHVSSAFVRDPLRILRAARFASRFGFVVHDDTLSYFRSIAERYMNALLNPDNASRVYNELSRIVVGKSPRLAFDALRVSNTLPYELSAMVGVRQSPLYHPEGDVFTHTLHVMDYASYIARRDRLSAEQAIVLGIAALLHDIGKVETTVIENGEITSRGHEEVSAVRAREFMSRFGFPNDIIEQVVALVGVHMRTDIQTPSGVRRLARDVSPSTVEMAVRLMEADSAGRPPLPTRRSANLDRILQIANSLNVQDSQPQAILMGRHLIEAGLSPSPLFGAILKAAFEAQLDGVFDNLEGALVYVGEFLKENPPAS